MMLSRMAEALYWMARYLERADNAARLLEINLMHLVETEETHLSDTQWQPLLDISASRPLFRELHGPAPINKETIVPFLTQDPANANSMINSLHQARENARVVRDRISKEMWESINHLWLWASDRLKTPLSADRAPAFCNSLRQETARFDGLASSTMMQGEAYGFYRMGLFFERADMTARILDVKYYILLPDVSEVGSALDYYQWMALLKSLSGFEAFRRIHHPGIRPIDVVDFVLLCPEFPRSIRFCIDRIVTALQKVSDETQQSDSHMALMMLKDRLMRETPQTIFQKGLHEFLADILRQLAGFNQALQADYFQARLYEKI